MIHFKPLAPDFDEEYLGMIPYFLTPADPRPAREQFDENYQHGGGWKVFKGHSMDPDGTLHYPGDPALPPLAEAKLRDETIRFYDYAWVSITQPDGTFEVCRMD